MRNDEEAIRNIIGYYFLFWLVGITISGILTFEVISESQEVRILFYSILASPLLLFLILSPYLMYKICCQEVPPQIEIYEA